MSSTADFLSLSRLLTGHAALPSGIGPNYESRLRAVFGAKFDQTVDAFAAVAADPAVGAKLQAILDADADAANVALQVIKVWYTSQFRKPDGKDDLATVEEEWKAALLWPTVHSPVPAYSPGPYGYWADRPA